MTQGRNKGNRAEREVAEFLQKWWRRLEPECRFVRTPGSGGWQGPEVRAEFLASGDLMTTAQRFPFCVEVKRREAWVEKTVRAGRSSPVWGWWRQAQREAKEIDRLPMLWFRANRQPWIVMVPAFLSSGQWGGIPLYMAWGPLDLENVDRGETAPVCFLAENLFLREPDLVARP